MVGSRNLSITSFSLEQNADMSLIEESPIDKDERKYTGRAWTEHDVEDRQCNKKKSK